MQMRPQRTAALPLLVVYAGLIVYASLYPFEGWRLQGLSPWGFLWAPWPQYWTGFDLLSNVLGYGPLGFLAALCLMRLRPQWPRLWPVAVAALALSLSLESLQMLLPRRVPSNVDWCLNGLGAVLGALVALALAAWGLLARWSRWRDRWLTPTSSGALVLLALWPVALLFPVAVPFGLGQVLERAERALAGALRDTPWIDGWSWREVALQPLLPLSEVICIALGMMLPCLLACGVLRSVRARLWASALGVALGLLASALSAALTYGPVHAWQWLTPQGSMAVALAIGALLALVWLPARVHLTLALVAVVWQLALLNQASANVYFAQTLQTWEQGRFIRFHGLIQWLGWLWPYALVAYLVRALSRRPT